MRYELTNIVTGYKSQLIFLNYSCIGVILKILLRISIIYFFNLSFAFSKIDLDQKLNQQWINYKNAQNELLFNIENNLQNKTQNLISRNTWEDIIRLNSEYQITSEDVLLLKNRQKIKIRQAKINSQLRSKIDFDILRKIEFSEQDLHKIKTFCEKIPKGGMLHVHPFGTFNRDTINQLLESQNPVLSIRSILKDIENANGNATIFPYEQEGLLSLVDGLNYLQYSKENQKYFQQFLFLPFGKQPFSRFNSVFYFLGTAVHTWVDYEKALFDFSRRAFKQGVIYVEFTSGFSNELASIIEKIQREVGLIIRVNYSFDRTQTPEDLFEQAKKILEMPRNKYLVGIDFLDNEEENPAFEKGQLLYGAFLKAKISKTSDLHLTMHAGELGDIRNPRDAIILGSERLGHGVNLMEDAIALEYASQNKIPVEINLVSNLRLTKINNLKEHPFLNYLRLGLPVSLSTDDEGIFDTDIKNECVMVIKETDISYDEFKQMSYNSIEYSFATESDKKLLLTILNQRFIDFEKSIQFSNQFNLINYKLKF